MKKILTLLFALMLFCAGSAVSANSQPRFELSGASAACGEEVTVSVSLVGSSDIASFTYDISYDAEKLIPIAVDKTELLSGIMVPNLSYSDDTVRVVFASSANIGSTGEILKLTFKAVDYQRGGYDTDLVGSLDFAGNQDLQTVSGSAGSAKISIAANPDFTSNPAKPLVISSVSCLANEEVTVSISAPDALEACSGSMTVCYDDGLRISQCEVGELLGELNIMMNPEPEKNQIRLNFMGITPISSGGELLRIKLLAPSNETADYRIFIKDIELYRLDESFVEVSSNVGIVSVSEVKPELPEPIPGGEETVTPLPPVVEDVDKPEPEIEPEPVEWTNPFADVAEIDWFFDSVKYAAQNRLMNGMTPNLFAPNETLTRAMLVTILYRVEGEPEAFGENPFTDVFAGDYYYRAVVWARQNGIVNGVTASEFAPSSSITREQIAAIIYRYAAYKGYDVSVVDGVDFLAYDDAGSISGYALTPMQYMVSRGIIRGKSETTLNPADFATRAEITAVLQRFLEMYR